MRKEKGKRTLEKVVRFSWSLEKVRSVIMSHQEPRWEDDPVFIDPLIMQLPLHLIIAALHFVHSSRKVWVKANLLFATKNFIRAALRLSL